MLSRSTLVVVERARPLVGCWATEPYEAGWAHEAIAFIRLMSKSQGVVRARAQISPDGREWVDEGTAFPPMTEAGAYFIRLQHFGNWLRLVGTVEGTAAAQAIVYWALKE
jgi:hypothetical protein